MNKYTWIIGWLLSPTRMIFDAKKKKYLDKSGKGDFYRLWSKRFISAEIFAFIVIESTTSIYSNKPINFCVAIILMAIAWSRINELVFAFYNDAIDILKGESQSSDLKPHERLQMALKSYMGLIVYFAIIYFFNLLESPFSREPNDFFDSVYFSAITITTTGYGDIHPISWVMKAFTMYEVIAGYLMVVIVIATYAGMPKEVPNKSLKDAP